MAKVKTSRKVFYSMGEVSEMFDVNPSLIRFWEKRFDVLRPKKNAKGNRLFTPEDVENLKIIYHLVKERGMTLAGAEKYMKDSRQQLKREVGVVEILQRMRSVLVDIRNELDSEAKHAENEIIIRSEEPLMIDPEAEPEDPDGIVEDAIREEEEMQEAIASRETVEIPGPVVTEEFPETLETPETPEAIAMPKIQNIIIVEEAQHTPDAQEPQESRELQEEKPRYIELSLFDLD